MPKNPFEKLDQVCRDIEELGRQLAKLENSLNALKANIQIYEIAENLSAFPIKPEMVSPEKADLLRKLGALGFWMIPLTEAQGLLLRLRKKYLLEKSSPLYEPLGRAKTLCGRLQDSFSGKAALKRRIAAP
jgi:hypothetical protein